MMKYFLLNCFQLIFKLIAHGHLSESGLSVPKRVEEVPGNLSAELRKNPFTGGWIALEMPQKLRAVMKVLVQVDICKTGLHSNILIGHLIR